MNIETHEKKLKESLEPIQESVERGLDERQRTIGFNTSAACADMLEILFHKKNLIDPGFMVKHEWLKSKNKVEEKFPFDFPKKKEILELVLKIEERRDVLCYGKPQKVEVIKSVLENFYEVKKLFKEIGVNGT
ncbi:MAG: hypothetical protein WC595_00665 [Candidatus Nanoarchaeia archaeon]